MRKKIVFVASLILLSFLMINLLLRGGLFSQYLKRIVTQKIEENLQAAVEVKDVRLNLFPPFFIVDGFSLKENSKEPFPLLKVKKIQIAFSPWSLLTEYFLIHKIQLQNPEIRLLWMEENKPNFNFLLEGLSHSKITDQKNRLIVQKIILMNGFLSIENKTNRSSASINHLEIKADADPTMKYFQITGSGKEITYQLPDGNNSNTISNLEWKVSVNPDHIEIKKLSLSDRESFMSVKGHFDFPTHQDFFPFKLDADFRLNTKEYDRSFSSIAGHGLFDGNFTKEGKVEGTVRGIHLIVEKEKIHQRIGDFESHFYYSSKILLLDHITSELFGGKVEGNVKVQMDSPFYQLESHYSIHNLPLINPTRLFFPEYQNLLEGKIVDADGTIKRIDGNINHLQAKGHFHLVGAENKGLDQKKRFWENGLIDLTLAEADYELDHSTFSFNNASLQIGVTHLTGNGYIKRDGTLSSFLSLESKNGGEVISWLGNRHWSGEVNFSGKVEGTLSSPVIEGDGVLKNVFFQNHSLGNGSTHFKYDHRQLLFSKTTIVKDSGQYSGEGSIQWNISNDFIYQIQAFASHGVPGDIITLFIENSPISTHVTGPLLISGENENFLIKGKLKLEDGRLYQQAFDRGSVELEITKTDISFDNATLTHGESTVTGNGKIVYKGEYQGELKSENLQLQDLNILSQSLPSLQGSFNGKIDGKGTFDHPQLSLNGTIPELAYKDQKLENGSLTLFLKNQEVQIHLTFEKQPLSLNGTVMLATSYPAKLEVQGKDVSLFYFLGNSSAFQQNSMNGSFSGKIAVEGPLSQPEKLNFVARLSDLRANLSGYEISNQDDIVFQLQEGKFNIESFHLKGEGTSLTLAGGMELFKQYSLFLTGEADLSLLKLLKKGISYGNGKAYLALSISDNWNNPKIQGGLTIQDGQIRTPLISQTITISSIGLFFNERQIFLESLDVGFGGGTLHSTGKIDINDFKLGHFGLILEAQESHFSIFPGWTSTVTGSLIYQGDLSNQDLKGELTLSHGVYDKNIEIRSLLTQLNKIEQRKEPTPFFGKTRLNIQLTGNEDLSIKNNIARIPFSLDLTVKGTIDYPVLIGRMESEEGTIDFYNRTFNVSSVVVDFINPEKITPSIDLKGRTEIKAKDKTYKIDLSLSGTLEEFNRTEFKPTFTADDPSLTETDILALILSGRTATEVASSAASQAQIGGQFVPLVIQTPFEGVVEQLTGANRVSIEPVTSGISTQGGPRVTLEKRLLGERLSLTYSYTIDPSQEQVIRMEYSINHNAFLQGDRDENGNVGGKIKFRFEFK